ncbi:MAG: transporter substrate-binding domain-containing protein [Selenomonadaceae bacterium]|nr:transporter substrate-binding domain-containing protein [Selenomonadaceae bacterium]
MKFKKVAKVFLSCMMAGALFTGCGGGGDKPAAEKPAAPAGEKGDIKLGMIRHLNATEQRMDEILKMVQEDSGVKVTHYVPTYYDSLNLMQMGIESGSVDQISLYKSVAEYLIANNDKYENVPELTLKTLSDNFCFAVRKEDAALKADLDKALDEMKADGSLEKLATEYIVNVDKGQVPPAVEIPMTDGADTIKVGVTGDLPPLDYVSADGKASGFNTALLAEIAKRSGKNVEIVDIDSGARAAALSSKQIDVVFWVTVPTLEKVPADLDKPEGVELSNPYFKDSVEHLQLKK